MATSTESLAARLASTTRRPGTTGGRRPDSVAGVDRGSRDRADQRGAGRGGARVGGRRGTEGGPARRRHAARSRLPSTGADIILSTAGLHGVLDYNPHDLTVTVLAGTPLADLQQSAGAVRAVPRARPARSRPRPPSAG